MPEQAHRDRQRFAPHRQWPRERAGVPLHQQRAQMECLPHGGNGCLPGGGLGFRHQLPDGQRRLHRTLRLLIKRLR
jgi:hypothetical protein